MAGLVEDRKRRNRIEVERQVDLQEFEENMKRKFEWMKDVCGVM